VHGETVKSVLVSKRRLGMAVLWDIFRLINRKKLFWKKMRH